ncbi:MAG TPA: FtsQ-type POTRA domain-containing protein [Acidimicrobiia bacterium]|nr:FtsQ-type POTRA domain-containing protein [Acidimicrobiia bacterium]
MSERERPHPRISDRRVAVKRAAGRRRLRVAGVLLVLFSLAGLAWLAVQSSLLDVEKIRVEGDRNARERDILQVAAVERGEPLLLVDRGAVAARVERLSWVREASVSFDLPSTLRIEVTERRPLAWTTLGEAAGAALVDAQGVVLEHRATPPEGLPELRRGSGAPAPGERLAKAGDPLAILDAAPPALASRIQWIGSRKGQYVLGLAGVERLLFGAPRDIAAKWATLETLLERLGADAVYQIDVRVPTAAGVRRAPPPPTTTTSAPSGTTTTLPAPPE